MTSFTTLNLDENENTRLIISIARQLPIPIIMQNLEIYKQHINHRNIVGNTALILAVYYENIVITKALLEHGADPNIGNHKEETPLMASISTGNIEIFKILINHPDIDVNYKSIPLAMAYHYQRGEMIDILWSIMTEFDYVRIPSFRFDHHMIINLNETKLLEYNNKILNHKYCWYRTPDNMELLGDDIDKSTYTRVLNAYIRDFENKVYNENLLKLIYKKIYPEETLNSIIHFEVKNGIRKDKKRAYQKYLFDILIILYDIEDLFVKWIKILPSFVNPWSELSRLSVPVFIYVVEKIYRVIPLDATNNINGNRSQIQFLKEYMKDECKKIISEECTNLIPDLIPEVAKFI